MKRLGPQRVEPALAIGAHLHESRITQDAEVPRYARLVDRQLRHQLVHGALPSGEGLEDEPSRGLSERFERIEMHDYVYTSLCIY